MAGEPKYLPTDPLFSYKAIHVGQEVSELDYGALVPPIPMSAVYLHSAPGEYIRGYEYGRMGTPIRTTLETCLASLDNGKFGLCFSSGMGTLTTIMHLLKNGDHLIAGDDLYGGSNKFFREICPNYGVDVTFVDMTEPKNVEKSLKPNTKMVFMESPCNPTMKLGDIKKIADISHKQKDVILVVDNTFLTSYFQKPLNLGADLVMYSLSKYMNGHTDIVMGALTCSSKALYDRLYYFQVALGIIPSPYDCYMVNRSLKTLKLRMEEHMKSGLAVARFLEQHKAVEKVLHPGLPSHPQHELALRQSSGHSGMVSFYIKGDESTTRKLAKSFKKVVILAESLGGPETLFNIPALMTHHPVPKKIRDSLGITSNLIRLSVGLDPVEDIIADLNQALNKIIEK